MRPLAIAMAVAVMATTGASVTHACGPDFAPELLRDRERTLIGMVDGVFAFEAGTLATPVDALRAPNVDAWVSYPELREQAEAEGLSPAQVELLKSVRAASNWSALESIDVSGLPASVRLYAEGALAYQWGDFDAAEARFASVLALPEDQRSTREAWALYMLGKLDARFGDGQVMAERFAQLRARVLAGVPDPLGLAVSSYGEEGFLHLRMERMPEAIDAYAQQAARGDVSGRASLLILARRLAREPETLRGLLTYPSVQALMSAYAYTRSNELLDEDERWSRYEASWQPGVVAMNPGLVEQLAAMVTQAAMTQWRGADRLAAAAYRAGRFELAQQWAGLAQGPMAAWVRSKLLLRDGNTSEALQALKEASAGFPAEELWLDDSSYDSFPIRPRCRVNAEQAALHLSREDFHEAAELFFEAGIDYWTDLAHVAERVLTLEELIQLAKSRAPTAISGTPGEASYDDNGVWIRDGLQKPIRQLRALLARRLMRQGEWQQALDWFDDHEHRAWAQALLDARNAMTSGNALVRAEAGFKAAQLTRQHGLELFGFEGDPDYAIHGGNYDLNSPLEYDEDYNPIIKPRKDVALPSMFASAAERQRVSASIAVPLERFHYRFVASELAITAAESLPHWSQAYAATLCHATRYVIYQDSKRATEIYRRYLNTGPYVAWGRDFGQHCPAPDFQKAAHDLSVREWASYRRNARQALPWVLGGAVLLAGWFLWRRRRTS